MIDLHCHLLPGVDDGAEFVHDALALAKIAVDDGIEHMVLTPHVHPGRYENSRSSLQPHFEHFEQALSDSGLKLKVSLAGEVRLSAEVLQMVANQEIPFLGAWNDYKVVLLELPHSHIPPGSDKLVKWLMDRKILPMIAHPERNKDIVTNLDKIRPFVEMGCLFQLTAMSVTGDFGQAAHQRSHEILENNWATVIATDAHNTQHRPPVLSRAKGLVSQLYGEKMAADLFEINPSKIIS